MSRSGDIGVVFDLDGVLAETEQLWEASWRAATARRGRTWTSANTARAQGMSSPEWSAYLADLVGRPDQAETVRSECVTAVVAAIERGEGPLLSGADDLVAAVAELVPVGLASSAARPVIEAVLREGQLTSYFTATVSSEQVPCGKPQPDVYQEAVRLLGVARAFAVEDSTNGLRAAYAAGLTVVALPNPSYPPRTDALRLADHVASDHADAKRYILGRLT